MPIFDCHNKLTHALIWSTQNKCMCIVWKWLKAKCKVLQYETEVLQYGAKSDMKQSYIATLQEVSTTVGKCFGTYLQQVHVSIPVTHVQSIPIPHSIHKQQTTPLDPQTADYPTRSTNSRLPQPYILQSWLTG